MGLAQISPPPPPPRPPPPSHTLFSALPNPKKLKKEARVSIACRPAARRSPPLSSHHDRSRAHAEISLDVAVPSFRARIRSLIESLRMAVMLYSWCWRSKNKTSDFESEPRLDLPNFVLHLKPPPFGSLFSISPALSFLP
ncbi:unnamed protein product [Linum trigynum]|uniref:Uncharacterized protein n=1 Tax=Linum trigynum TaxID=586398 RepID=A0AAV2CBC3_9ROSI